MTTTPHVWIDCRTCHEAGSVNGAWVAVTDLRDCTTAQLHAGPTDHTELDVYHEEDLPRLESEDRVAEAIAWGDAWRECAPGEWPALLAWHDDVGETSMTAEGLPDVETFHEVYRGNYESFLEFAEAHAEDIGVAGRYFDVEAYARDLAGDFTVLDAEHGVHVYDAV